MAQTPGRGVSGGVHRRVDDQDQRRQRSQPARVSGCGSTLTPQTHLGGWIGIESELATGAWPRFDRRVRRTQQTSRPPGHKQSSRSAASRPPASWKDRRSTEHRRVHRSVEAAKAAAFGPASEVRRQSSYRSSQRSSPGDLHHQHDRIGQLPAPQSHKEPRPLPQRTLSAQTPVLGHQKHQHPKRRTTRNKHPRMESLHQPASHPLPTATPSRLT